MVVVCFDRREFQFECQRVQNVCCSRQYRCATFGNKRVVNHGNMMVIETACCATGLVMNMALNMTASTDKKQKNHQALS